MSNEMPEEIWINVIETDVDEYKAVYGYAHRCPKGTKYIRYDEYENLKHDLERYMDIANGYINGSEFQAIEQENFALQKTIRELAAVIKEAIEELDYDSSNGVLVYTNLTEALTTHAPRIAETEED